MKLLVPFAVIAVLLAGIVAMDDTPQTADLVFVNRGDVFTLDPQRMSYLQDFRLAYALFEGLVRWDNTDFSITHAAAEHWEISPDQLTYSFRIREDARWSNGDPVTSHDFIYSWMRLLLPDTAADYSNLFFMIDGAAEFWEWRSEVTDALAVDVSTDTPAQSIDDVRLLNMRLETLLAAERLPEEISRHLPRDNELASLHAELAEVDDTVNRLTPERQIDCTRWPIMLHTARQLRNDQQARTSEARWWWERTLDHFDQTVGLYAADEHHLEIRLARPTAYFLDLLAFGVCYPVHRPTVEGWVLDEQEQVAMHERGWFGIEQPPFSRRSLVSINASTGRLEQKHQWARPGVLVCNGPYMLTEWRYKRDMRLQRNPMFHSPDMARSETIVALSIEDANTAVLAFESGRLDWLSEVNAEYQADMIAQRAAYESRHREQLDALLAEGKTIDEALAALPEPEPGERRNIHVFPTFGTDFYSFNCRPKLADGRTNPFADPRVRRAFVMAVDKHAIVTQVTRLNEPIVSTLIPPNSIPGYEGPAGLQYNPARALDELRAAGWEDRDGDGRIENEDFEPFPTIDLLWTTNTLRYKWISLELKAQWERALGVRVELRGADTKFYKEDLKDGKFMIARGRWYGDYGDPTTFLELCRSTDGNNDRGYKHEYVDKLLDQAAIETDPAKRMRLLEECERFLFDEEVPMLVLCQLVQVYMYEPGELKGLSRHPRLTQYLWKMEAQNE